MASTPRDGVGDAASGPVPPAPGVAADAASASASARAASRLAEVRGATIEALETLRDELAAERESLQERARACAWGGAPEDAEIVGALCDLAILTGAVESSMIALEDGVAPDLRADEARRRALAVLADLAGSSARAGGSASPAGSSARARIEAMRDAIPAAAADAQASDARPTEDAAPARADDRELTEAEMEARSPHLEGAELEAALEQVPIWPVAPLAERLAALGRTEEVPAFVARFAGSGWPRALAALRAASAASAFPGVLRDFARASIEALPPPQRGRLCGEHPEAAVRVFGAEDTLRFADEAGDDLGQYVRITALARVASALPEPLRARAAALALDAFASDPDTDALGELVRCAPWMPPSGAAALLADHLGRRATPRTFAAAFTSYAGIGPFAPLIARAAGDAGLLAAATAIVRAGSVG